MLTERHATNFHAEVILETERLILRPSSHADIPQLFEFLGDPVANQVRNESRN